MLHAPASEAQSESASAQRHSATAARTAVDIRIEPPIAGNQALLRQPAGRAPLRPNRAPLLQRQCACGATAGLSGECAECQEKKEESALHRKAAGDGAAPGVAPPIVHEVLRSAGAPLDAETRAAMEPRFGVDFGAVRVHTDAKAAASARAVNAQAYTVGHDIVFASGQHAPRNAQGQRLIAHELTHVTQQGADAPLPSAPLAIGPADDVFEREADRAAATMEAAAGRSSASAHHAEPALRRQTDGATPAAAETPTANEPPYPPDVAETERLRKYLCVAEADKTKPKARPCTTDEILAMANALDSAKGTIARAISNFAQRDSYHIGRAMAGGRRLCGDPGRSQQTQTRKSHMRNL
jgi:Domain of unknown function (DUF4157)